MKQKIIYLISIVIILAIAYYLTLAPGLSWANGGADGGDLITAVAVNGIPHPTGYPLYLIIAKLFQTIPFGNLAYRTNIFSAFCTILAAMLLFLTSSYVQKERKYSNLSAIVAALLFGFSPLVWSQAVITEVYGLQSLLTVGILYLTIRMGDKPYQDLLRGWFFGLAIGNHITTIFLIPFLLIDIKKFRVSPISHLALRIFGLLAGSAIYLILPFRATQNPVINWLNPINFPSFFQLISGQIYRSYFSIKFVIDHARAWAGILIENLTIPGVFIGLFSLLEFKKNREINLLTIWMFGIFGIFALFYVTNDSYVYLIPTIIAFSIWISLGIGNICNLVSEKSQYTNWALVTLMVGFFILRIYSVLPNVNASNDERAEIFGQSAFDSMPEGALVFTTDDQSTFALWYFHFAIKKRPDLKIISEGLLKYEWYRQNLRTTYPSLKIPELSDLAPFKIIIQNPEYKFCFIDSEGELKGNCS